MFGKCVLINKPKRRVVNTQQVTVVKFLGPELCNSYFPYSTAGKVSIFSRKKNPQDFSLMTIDRPHSPHISDVLFPYD